MRIGLAVTSTFIAILIAIAAFGVRLKAAGNLPLDPDERAYFPASQRYSIALHERNWAEIIDEDFNAEHPPLAKILYGAVLASSGAYELTDNPAYFPSGPFHLLRVSSAVLSVFQVLLLALFNPLAGFFLAMHTWQIKYTSLIMLESLPSLSSLFAVIAYEKSERERNFWLYLSALGLGLTAASKYIYALVGIAIALHWLWQTRSEVKPFAISDILRWLSPVILWGMIAIGAFFLFDPHLWRDPLTRLTSSVLKHGAYLQLNASENIVFPFWQPLIWLFRSAPPDPGVFLVRIDPIITLFALIGVVRLFRKHTVFAFWLFVGLAFLLIWPTKWPQYILVLTVPLAISASEGVQFILLNSYTSRLQQVLRRWIPARVFAGNDPIQSDKK